MPVNTKAIIPTALYNFEDYIFLRKLLFAGIEINGKLTNENGLPFLAIGESKHLIWVFPEMERFLLLYLLTGNNTNIPKYLKDNKLSGFRTKGNYIYKHIKREIERGEDKYEYKEETQDDTDGIRFIGLYPYGSIDYGFFPHSWEEFTSQLESVEPFKYEKFEEAEIPDLHYNSYLPEYLDLADGAKLDSVFPDKRIPTNTIIDKTICGCGATWLEIHADRNSIIIEPNVPVIISKEHKHPQIIGVYGEDIEVQDIAQRIAEQTGYVKIMTTPDSWWKVEEALHWLGIPYGLDYFMLFDECEKMVSEIDFRPNLSLPIDDFFNFRSEGEGKAMVSATPIVMSDPRFGQQEFKIIKIRPQSDHKRLLELKPTNNVNIAVKRAYEKIGKETPICFFYNSVEGAEDLIAFLGISDQSNIYCSTAARKKLKKKDYSNSNVSDSVIDKDGKTTLNKYNFFTSRFYSGVDIELDYTPVVIMISDVHKKVPDKKVIDPKTQEEKTLYKYYTLIDPETEAIQIAGRFRNGIERLIHITNTNYDISYYTREDLEQNLKGQHSGLHKLEALYQSAEDNGEKEIIYDAIHNTEYWKGGYVNWKDKNGGINYFRHNNAFLDERMKMLYNFPASLYKAYKRSEAFNVVSESEYVIYTDEEKSQLENGTLKQKAKLLNDILTRNADSENPQDFERLKKEFAQIFEALSILGYARMKALRFSVSAITAEMEKVKQIKKTTTLKVIKEVYKHFKPNKPYLASDINKHLKRIFDSHNITYDGRGAGKLISLYFEAEESRGTGGKRIYKLGSKLF